MAADSPGGKGVGQVTQGQRKIGKGGDLEEKDTDKQKMGLAGREG